jgi:hypothetical protein
MLEAWGYPVPQDVWAPDRAVSGPKIEPIQFGDKLTIVRAGQFGQRSLSTRVFQEVGVI